MFPSDYNSSSMYKELFQKMIFLQSQLLALMNQVDFDCVIIFWFQITIKCDPHYKVLLPLFRCDVNETI